VHEFAAPDGDPDMRGAGRHRLEKYQIAWLDLIAIDFVAGDVLVAHFTWQRDSAAGEHPLHEPAAVETRRIAAAVPIRYAPEGKCRPNKGVPIEGCRPFRCGYDWIAGRRRRLGGAGKWPRDRAGGGAGCGTGEEDDEEQ
jgi:hypothetical protein